MLLATVQHRGVGWYCQKPFLSLQQILGEMAIGHNPDNLSRWEHLALSSPKGASVPLRYEQITSRMPQLGHP